MKKILGVVIALVIAMGAATVIAGTTSTTDAAAKAPVQNAQANTANAVKADVAKNVAPAVANTTANKDVASTKPVVDNTKKAETKATDAVKNPCENLKGTELENCNKLNTKKAETTTTAKEEVKKVDTKATATATTTAPKTETKTEKK